MKQRYKLLFIQKKVIRKNRIKTKVQIYMKQIENMVIDNIKKCFDGKLSSKDLGLWAEKLWYYYVEGKGKNITLKNEGKILDLLLDIASQWGMISSPFS